MMTQTDSFLENILLFIYMLRQAGLPVSLDQSIDFAQALTLVEIGERQQVYHAARCLLVTRHEHLRLFDSLFNSFWGAGTARPQQRRPSAQQRRQQPQAGLATLIAFKARGEARTVEVPDQTKIYSDLEVLQSKAFAEMTREELDAMKHLIQKMRWRMSLRRTRRRIPNAKGNFLHQRRIMRSALSYGGIPLYLAWQSRKIKQRPIVLIADISGSMENFSRLILQFFHSMSHGLKHVECFVFGTRLTRITPQLKLKNVDLAIEEATYEVLDWSGGTRIGESLHMFNQRWSRRVLRRGAIVMIVSDGWERGNIALLHQAMRYLRHRCHRLIWLNPLLGKATYQPVVEGMAAALPYIDHFLPCHNLRSLEELGEYLENLENYSTPQRRFTYET